MEGQTEAKNAKLKKCELPRAKIPSKCKTVLAVLWKNFNEAVTCLQIKFLKINNSPCRKSEWPRTSFHAWTLACRWNRSHVSDLRSVFVYPYCVRVETESGLTMSGAQKISSRSRSLTASDTKALLLHAEALLALEKGVGKRRNGIF